MSVIASKPARCIIAIGGNLPSYGPALPQYLKQMFHWSGKAKPKILFIITASGDSKEVKNQFLAALVGLPCSGATFLPFFDRTPRDLRKLVEDHDVVFVGGGCLVSALAVWQCPSYQLDVILREAWENGKIIGGTSAGGMCWFDHTCADSFAEVLTPVRALGFVPESFSPHYNVPGRRQEFHEWIASGKFKNGFGVDECAALVVVDAATPSGLRRQFCALSRKPGAEVHYVYRIADGVAGEVKITSRGWLDAEDFRAISESTTTINYERHT